MPVKRSVFLLGVTGSYIVIAVLPQHQSVVLIVQLSAQLQSKFPEDYILCMSFVEVYLLSLLFSMCFFKKKF